MMHNIEQYNVSMEEIHHTQKLDAPSGTAISLANDIIENSKYTNWTLENPNANEIKIDAKRIENVPGTHSVFYDSLGTLACAGFASWQGSGISITAYGNFGNLKGFKTNESFKFKIWRKVQNCIIDSVQVLFASPDQTLITDSSRFADNGVSQINQIKGFY